MKDIHGEGCDCAGQAAKLATEMLATCDSQLGVILHGLKLLAASEADKGNAPGVYELCSMAGAVAAAGSIVSGLKEQLEEMAQRGVFAPHKARAQA